MVITYKFCWVWKLYKSAVQFPMANQLNFPYLSIFIAFGWCLLLGAGGRSLIRVIHVLNKASCPPATPWCHRLHAWDWAGTPAASTPRGWAASTAHSGPCRAACGAAKRVPPKGHPGASQRPLWGLMLSLLRLLLEIMAAGEVSLYKDPLLEQQLPPGGGVGRGGWEPPHSAAAPTYLGGEEQKCQSSSLFARCLGLLSSPSFGMMLLRAGKGSLGAQVRLLASRTPLSLQPRLRKKLCCVKCIFLSVSAGKKTCFAIALMVRKSMTDKERI